MLAYSDGDIVTRINTSILSHNEMRKKISFLLGSDNSGNLIQKLFDRQETRPKVAHAVVYARKVEPDDDTFVSDDTPECRVLWETATDNVFEMADADDNNQ